MQPLTERQQRHIAGGILAGAWFGPGFILSGGYPPPDGQIWILILNCAIAGGIAGFLLSRRRNR